MEQPSVQSNSVFESLYAPASEIKKEVVPQTAGKKQGENFYWNCFQNSLSAQSMLNNCKNFKISDVPGKLMQWSNEAWVQLSDEALSAAKSAFSEKQPMVEMRIDGNNYIFDFYRMLQIDLGSGFQRSIAWIDVKGDCYFPQFFVDESLVDDDDDGGVGAETPKIEIEVKIDTDNCKDKDNDDDNRCKRKVRKEADNEDTANSSCNNFGIGNSKRQRLVPPAAYEPSTQKWPNTRLLSEGERSFSVVRDLFMSGMKSVDPSVSITSIRAYNGTGRTEIARWKVFQTVRKMTEAARGRSNTMFAWHGTSKKNALEIFASGFGWPRKVIGPRVHGDGLYLSSHRLPHLSDKFSESDENGERHLILCRVILGNMEKIEAGSQQFHPSSFAFDSGVDDLDNPKWYIVWSTKMNTHINPECIVSYKCSNGQNGERLEVDSLNWIPRGSSSVVAKLFSKLRISLPAPKVEELKALCMTFKARKMAKELFIKRLKVIVGKDMLQSAIYEIQSSN